ncbi:hypothetical protein [Fundidesulfovibrio agrisoli]|uniref:hypothetical protein n=1 Tax=Fundidesulfovibrio agrisoli TaxID=2922717 RepID=UPI001FADB100|nr:hypothetical protein [Fundidesulfovibrio agrisoli]
MKGRDELGDENAGAADDAGVDAMMSVERELDGADQSAIHQEGLDSFPDVVDGESGVGATGVGQAAPVQALLGFPSVNTERGKKARCITQAEAEPLADVLVEFAREGRFPDGLIPVNAGADYFGVAASVFAQIFSMADRRGLRDIPGPGIFLDYDDIKQPKPAMTAFIDARGMLMIGKSTLEALSNDPPNILNFKRGDSFNVSLRGEEIVLSRR